MINQCMNEQEKSLLKSIIGQKLIRFKSEKPDAWNHIFGNISIVVENSEAEIRNELTPIEYFGDTEDVSKFYVNKITSEYPFNLMIVDSVYETPVNEKIEDVILLQDIVVVKDACGKLVYEITIDTAITIKTEIFSFSISRDWSLEELMFFVKSTDFKKDIYSVQQMIEEWGDEENGWKASCERKFISLKESSDS